MKPQNRVRADLDEIARLTRDLADLAPRAVANWKDWSGLGWPAGSGNGRNGGTSNPTERFALNAAEARERDRFASDWAAHEAAITSALMGLRKAYRLARAATNTTETAMPEGCELCERVRVNGRPAQWQEIRTRVAPCDSVPDRPRCDWHWRFARDYGEDASPTLASWHLSHKGAKCPPSLIRQEHPEAWARVQQTRRAS